MYFILIGAETCLRRSLYVDIPLKMTIMAVYNILII